MTPEYVLLTRVGEGGCVGGWWGFADAILGVALFKEVAPTTFGRFNRAFVSMFRIACGETWIDGLPFLDDSGDISWRSSLFICSYMVLNVWVVLQARTPLPRKRMGGE
jgi:hypothetical protein